MFSPLVQTQIRRITDIQLAHLKDRLKAQHLTLSVSQDVSDKLAEAGYDPVYGARPLKRAIRQMVENPLAEALLMGQFEPGDAINIIVQENKIIFQNLNKIH